MEDFVIKNVEDAWKNEKEMTTGYGKTRKDIRKFLEFYNWDKIKTTNVLSELPHLPLDKHVQIVNTCKNRIRDWVTEDFDANANMYNKLC